MSKPERSPFPPASLNRPEPESAVTEWIPALLWGREMSDACTHQPCLEQGMFCFPLEGPAAKAFAFMSVVRQGRLRCERKEREHLILAQ